MKESEGKSMEYAIKIRNLTKRYGDFCLDHINLNVPMGSIVGLIGENGAGKTTTIKALLNIAKPDGGQIEILGKSLLENEKEIKEQIGVVLGESHFHEFLNACEVGHIMRNIYCNWDDEAFSSWLSKFSLPEKKKLKEYSKGMKMKLSIAAALSHHPKLLILDEATSGLDPVIRDSILDIFFEFIEDGEHSVLISSHITSDLDKVADYVAMIHQGRILFSEEKDVMLEDMGVLRCRKDELKNLHDIEIIGTRQNAYGTECLVKNREQVKRQYPGLVVDRTNIEEIMLFYVRGMEG